MPKETFWDSATAVENDGVSEPVLTVTWGEAKRGVYLNGVHFDRSGIDRLVHVLRKAQDRSDQTVTINGVVLGNADELARIIARIIRDAKSRGTIPPDALA